MGKNLKFRKYLIIILIICLGILLSAVLSGIVYRAEKKRLEYEFIMNSTNRFELIKDHINSHIEVLYTLGGLYASSDRVERHEFSKVTKIILAHYPDRYPDIMAVDWMPRILDSQRIEFEESVRREGYPDFEIKDIDPQGNFVRADKREEYFPVYYLESFSEDKDRFGLDMGIRRREKMQEAEDKNTTVMSLRARVEQQGKDVLVCRIFLPIYRNNTPVDTVEQRRENLTGFVSEVFRIGDLIDTALKDIPAVGIDIDIYDLTQGKELIYSRPSQLKQKMLQPVKQGQGLVWSKTLDAAESKWMILFRSTAGFMAGYGYWQTGIVLIIGLGLTVILALYLFTVLGQNVRIIQLVDERTNELNMAKERAELIYKIVPSAIFTVDRDCCITSWNDRAVELTGYTAEEVIGKDFRQFSDCPCKEECRLNFFRILKPIIGQESSIIRKDGKKRKILKNVGFLKDENGKTVGGIETFEDITERKESEEVLRTLRLQDELILDSAGDGILGLDSEGKVTFINKFALDLLGYSEPEVIGKSSHELWHHSKPDGSPYLEKECQLYAVSKDGIVRNIKDEVFWKRDGASFPIEYTSTPIVEKGVIKGAVVVFKDISERKQIEDRLRDAYVATHDILSKLPFGIYIVNDKGGIDYVNPAMLNMAGTSYEEFMNLNVFTLPTYRQIGLDEKIKSAITGEFFVMKNVAYTSYISKKITIRDFTGMPFEEAGEKKALVFVEDITERRRLEQLKDEFVSNVSHELRTPLSIIKEGISLILDKVIGDTNPKQSEVLSIAKSSIDRLARVINELLDISKIESGKLELKKTDTDIVDLIKLTAVSFEQKIKDAGIELKLDLGSKKISTFIDADMIIQVFMNLIANALRFTKQGFIKISVAEKDDKIECMIEDTGMGIAPENIPHLFEKFQQFDRTHGPGEKGTGLGLSIAKGIIDMHNGNIWVESQLGVGTKFIFSLPKSKEILP